jgi:hypothetical protein
MRHEMLDVEGKVVALQPRRTWRVRWRSVWWRAGEMARSIGWFFGGAVWMVLGVAWWLARLALAALLVLMEPLVAIVLLPIAFVGFLVTVVMGFMLDTPGFPKWPMLGMSVGALVLYWLFLMLTWFVIAGGRRGRY